MTGRLDRHGRTQLTAVAVTHDRLQLLVVAPTRELAVQVYGVARKLSAGGSKFSHWHSVIPQQQPKS